MKHWTRLHHTTYQVYSVHARSGLNQTESETAAYEVCSAQLAHILLHALPTLCCWCDVLLQVSASHTGGCSALAWRGFNPGVAPLLAVGTASGVDVWQYVAQFMTWQVCASYMPNP